MTSSPSDVFELVRLADQFHLESVVEGCVRLIDTALEMDFGIFKSVRSPIHIHSLSYCNRSTENDINASVARVP